MGHSRQLCFESLEARELLSGVGHGRPHATHTAAIPLVLDGTLTVDNNAATTSMDEVGDTITSTPVAGQLGALGAVHGIWTTGIDEYGDYSGPDTLKVRDPKGTFTVVFSEQHTAQHHLVGGAVYYQDPQIAYQGTGAYTGVKESGSIELTTNKSRTAIESLTLATP